MCEEQIKEIIETKIKRIKEYIKITRKIFGSSVNEWVYEGQIEILQELLEVINEQK